MLAFQTPVPAEAMSWFGTSGLNATPPISRKFPLEASLAAVSQGMSVELTALLDQSTPLQVTPAL